MAVSNTWHEGFKVSAISLDWVCVCNIIDWKHAATFWRCLTLDTDSEQADVVVVNCQHSCHETLNWCLPQLLMVVYGQLLTYVQWCVCCIAGICANPINKLDHCWFPIWLFVSALCPRRNTPSSLLVTIDVRLWQQQLCSHTPISSSSKGSSSSPRAAYGAYNSRWKFSRCVSVPSTHYTSICHQQQHGHKSRKM